MRCGLFIFFIFNFFNTLGFAKTKINLEISNNRTMDGQLALKNEHHQSVHIYEGQEASIKTKNQLMVRMKAINPKAQSKLVEFRFIASIPSEENPIELINTKIIGLIGDSTTFSAVDPRGFNVIFTLQLLEEDPIDLYP